MTDAAGTTRTVLHKPPGYRDPVNPQSAAAPRPPPRKAPAPLPPTFRNAGKATRRHHRPRRSFCCRLFCCLSLLVFSLLFILAILGGLSYLYFQPHLPSFRLQSIQTPHLNVSSRPDGGGTFLDASVAVKIFASNPNGKIALSYGQFRSSVYVADKDGDVEVGSGSIPGFEQGRRNATVLRFSARATGVLLDDSVGSRLKERFRSKEMRVGVEVRTRVGMRMFGGKVVTGRVPIRVDCQPVSLRTVKSGGLLPKCDIYLFRWINLH